MSLKFSMMICGAVLTGALTSGAARAESVAPALQFATHASAPAASFRIAASCIRRDRTCEYSTQCCAGLVCVDHGSKGTVCAPGR